MCLYLILSRLSHLSLNHYLLSSLHLIKIQWMEVKTGVNMVRKQNTISFLLHLNLCLLKYAMCAVTKWSLWDGQLIEWGEEEHNTV